MISSPLEAKLMGDTAKIDATTSGQLSFADTNKRVTWDTNGGALWSGGNTILNWTTVGSDSSITIPTNAGLEVGGNFTAKWGVKLAYRARTTALTIASTDYLVDCTSGTFALTLPSASSVGVGKVYIMKNSGSGVTTINTTSSQTVDGQASGTITLNQYDSITVMSNGANWIII